MYKIGRNNSKTWVDIQDRRNNTPNMSWNEFKREARAFLKRNKPSLVGCKRKIDGPLNCCKKKQLESARKLAGGKHALTREKFETFLMTMVIWINRKGIAFLGPWIDIYID